MPKVTVLMAVYNGERYLREAMDSILGQTFRDFEFLIVDDGSDDSTTAIIGSFNDSRIRVIRNENNLGLTKSLNIGLRAAKGEYVARMDADDISLPERLERQVGYLDEHPDDALVGCPADVIGKDGQIIRRSLTPAPSRRMLYLKLAFGNVMAHSSAMFRRSVVEQLGGYDESYTQTQDYDLWFRIFRSHGAGMLDEVLIRWRSTPEGVCERFRDEQGDCARRIFEKNVREVMPDISAGDLERLTRLHDRSAVWPGLGGATALWRYGKAILASCPVSVSGKSQGQKDTQDIKKRLKRYIVDLKTLVAICFPGIYTKTIALFRGSS